MVLEPGYTRLLLFLLAAYSKMSDTVMPDTVPSQGPSLFLALEEPFPCIGSVNDADWYGIPPTCRRSLPAGVEWHYSRPAF